MLKVKTMIIKWLFTHGKEIIINELKELLGNKVQHACQCRKDKEVVLEIVEGIDNIYTEAYDNPACYDIKANENVLIPPREYRVVRTGIKMNIPETHWLKIYSRSGWSAKHGVEAGAGVIDSDYKGEVCVILYNNSDIDFIIEKGDRIAQFTLHKKENVKINKGDKLQESTRGDKGFGSSGK